ncbi:MAG: nSTAND1 domain-containing NTPase [Methylobacter sp.]
MLLDSAAANRHALPLLEFTLDALYQRAAARRETVLSFADFEALGGLEGAVATAAEAALEPLGEAALPAVRDLFRQLVDMDHGQVLPRRASRADLAGDDLRTQVLDNLIDQARLLVSGADGAVEITHAALLRSWQRLTEWIAEDAELLAIRSRIEELAANWRDAGHDAGYLLSPGKQEQDARLLQQQPWVKLVAEPTQFLALSLRRIRRARRNRRLTLAGAVTSFLVLSGGFSWVNYQQRNKAEAAADLAMQAVNRLTYELPDRLSKLPGTLQVLQQTFEQNADLLQRIDALRGETADSMREKASNLSKHGNQRLAQGDLAGALASYRAGLAIREKLAAQAPSNAGWQSDLAFSHGKLGLLLQKMTKPGDALAQFRAAQAILEPLTLRAPDQSQWRKALGTVKEKIAAIEATGGKATGHGQR